MRGGDDLLLVRRAADLFGMRGIAADGDHETFGDGEILRQGLGPLVL